MTASFISSTPEYRVFQVGICSRRYDWICSAISWKKVLVVRPQPGQAVTCGVKLRMPSDCRICWPTRTSSVRSPPGAGVSETRMVSPMPSCRSTPIAAEEATMPLAPMPASVSQVQRVVAARGERAVDVDQILHAADFRAEDNLVGTQAVFFGECGGVQRTYNHGFHGDFAGVFGLGKKGILVHHPGEQRAVERAPVHADADRFLIF